MGKWKEVWPTKPDREPDFKWVDGGTNTFSIWASTSKKFLAISSIYPKSLAKLRYYNGKLQTKERHSIRWQDCTKYWQKEFETAYVGYLAEKALLETDVVSDT